MTHDEPRKTKGWTRWGDASWREAAKAEHRAKLEEERRMYERNKWNTCDVLEERERRAYIDGDVEKAALLARVIDLEDEVQDLRDSYGD